MSDAKAIIRFAHKYTMNSWLEACEAYVLRLAQEDMSGDPVDHLFTSNQVQSVNTLHDEQCRCHLLC